MTAAAPTNGDDFPTVEAYACFVAAEAGDGKRDALRFAEKYNKYATAIVALGDVPLSPEAYHAECREKREARRAELLSAFGRA